MQMTPFLFNTDLNILQLILLLVEQESGHYNMRLNEDKCYLVTQNYDSTQPLPKLYFSDGITKVNAVRSTTYLGGMIADAGELIEDIEKKRKLQIKAFII